MSSFSSDSTLSWLKWLQQSQAAFDALPSDDYGLYELLHQQASCIAPLDSCYFCLYRGMDKTLFFVYNFDGELYDEPLTLAMGNGPTSWVVNHGQPFVLREDTQTVQHGNVQFGYHQRFSRSAIHLPIGVRERNAPSDGTYSEILGVFSIQSYQPNVYTPETVVALQLLCDYVALHMQRKGERVALEQSRCALTDKFKEHEAYKIRLANHIVELLQPLSRQIQTLSHALAKSKTPSISELRGQTVEVSRLCSRLQTQISQLPIENRPLPHGANGVSAAASIDQECNPLDVLSERELEVLRLMANGSTNEQIANALNCSIHTSKKHCANIYNKLDIKGRAKTINFYNRHAGGAKIILSSNQK